MPLDYHHSVCPHDCPSVCALEVERLDNRTIGRVRGARANNYTQGVICAKVARYTERVHHPDRLMKPLIRVGAKGEGKFVEASWDEALDKAAAGLLEAVNEHGRHSVYAVASGRALNEAGYTMQKLVRAGLGTSYIDNCSRA